MGTTQTDEEFRQELEGYGEGKVRAMLAMGIWESRANFAKQRIVHEYLYQLEEARRKEADDLASQRHWQHLWVQVIIAAAVGIAAIPVILNFAKWLKGPLP